MRKLVGAFGVTLAAACAAAPRSDTARSVALADADSTRSTVIADGVTHTRIHHSGGPWAVHVVSIDPRQCRPVLRARKPGTSLAGRATTSAIAGDALAAINADFFMLPGGTPVGAHVEGGVPLIGPTSREVFGVTAEGYEIGAAEVAGHVRTRTDSAAITQVNRAAAAFSAYAGTKEGVTLFTAWVGDTVPADSSAQLVRLRLLHGNEESGAAVVMSTSTMAAREPLPAGAVLLQAAGSARAWASRRVTGDTVVWSAHVRVNGRGPVREAVGGFPELLRGGRNVLHEKTVRPEFGDARHPRTALGWTAAGELLLVVVDGRQPPYSDGMSLAELTWLFQRLGATDALNLDGGGSTALVIRGALVNRPSDREGERPVGNALVLERCAR